MIIGNDYRDMTTKLIYICSEFPGISNTFIFREIETLKEKVLAAIFPPDLFRSYAIEAFGVVCLYVATTMQSPETERISLH